MKYSKKKIAMMIAIGVAVITAAVLYVTIGFSTDGSSVILASREEHSIDASTVEDGDDAGEPCESVTDSSGETVFVYGTTMVQEETSRGPVLVIYICGAVLSPAVYEMETNARICDVIEAAGGLLENADPNQVNQAETVCDGEMIYIPYHGEKAVINTTGSGQGNASAESGKININTADANTLTSLPGIGESKAASIVEYRSQIGAFGSIEEIKNVPGIGDSLYARIQNYICVN